MDSLFATRQQWILWIMLMGCLMALALVESYNLYLNKTFSKAEIEAHFAPLITRYGIKIVYEVDNNFLSDLVNPIIPAGPSRNSLVTPIRHRVLIRYSRLLTAAFEKYPKGVIQKNLTAIHFAGRIIDEGWNCGGAYDPFRRIIYFVDNGHLKDDHAISAFHHEFSSLLLNHHSLFLNPWFDQNPKDFVYAYDAEKDHLKVYNQASLDGTESDFDKGFMNTYGQTDFENDFNEYSAMIFTYPEKFKQIMARHPRVRGKFLVWLKFYQEIDPIFTEEYLLGPTARAG
jgi:hypothetical protein